MHLLVVIVSIAIAYGVYDIASGLRRNIAKAKRTGLPYIVAPCYPRFLPWLITYEWLLSICGWLPNTRWHDWIDPISPGWAFRTSYEGFARYGDVFLIVSPRLLTAMVCNAEAIRQIMSRREHFPKPLAVYAILRQFGDNIVASEGATWRMHRKATSASFNEKNSALVFAESIHQTQGLIHMWRNRPTGLTESIHSLDRDTMRLALHVIGYVGFGLRFLWPGGTTQKDGTDIGLAKYGSLEPPPGYDLTFGDTVVIMLENLMSLLVMPSWLTKFIPSKKLQRAEASRRNWKMYMRQLLKDKTDAARHGDHVEGMDLMGQLVRSSLEANQTDGLDSSKAPSLTEDDISGNVFAMVLAGHETSANAMHFTLVELANNPEAQRSLQREIDEMVGTDEPTSWDYGRLINPMLAGMPGACLSETLRTMPPVVEIPKMVTPDHDRAISIDGQEYVLPGGTYMNLIAVSVHKHPRYWPALPSKVHKGKDDINDWVPERWFRPSIDKVAYAPGTNEGSGRSEDDKAGDGVGGNTRRLFRPERGAYVPFSDGPRSCLGRRIAEVEILASLAVIFQKYSIELAVDEWADDDQVDAMNRDQKQTLYARAQATSRAKIQRARTRVTLKLNGTHVPVRLVKRGEERFVSWMGMDTGIVVEDQD